MAAWPEPKLPDAAGRTPRAARPEHAGGDRRSRADLMGDPWLHPGLRGIAVPFALGYRSLYTGLGIIGGYLAAVLGLYVRGRIGGACATDAPADGRRVRARASPRGRRRDRQLKAGRPHGTAAQRGADRTAACVPTATARRASPAERRLQSADELLLLGVRQSRLRMQQLEPQRGHGPLAHRLCRLPSPPVADPTPRS